MSFETIKAKAKLIRNEMMIGGNTKERIAGTIDDINLSKVETSKYDKFVTENKELTDKLDKKIDAVSLSAVKGVATPTSKPTDYNPIQFPDGLFEKWEVKQTGTYVNFKNSAGNPILVSQDDLDQKLTYINVTNGVSELSSIRVGMSNVVDGFESTSTTTASSSKNATTLMNIIKAGSAIDWVLGPYKKGDIVRRNGLLYIALADITNAVPGNNANWKLYSTTTKSKDLITSMASTLIINLVSQTVQFIGTSTNKISTPEGVFNITPQTISTNVNDTYYVVIYNTITNVARAVTTFNNNSSPLGAGEYVLFYVLNLNATTQDVFGVKGYRLINSTGTVDYPQKPVQVEDVTYNRTFESYRAGTTSSDKFWLAKAIVDVEFYNIKNDTLITFYGLGKNYTGNVYLGFIIAEPSPTPAKQLFADEFNNALSMVYDPNVHTGIKTYLLRNGNKKESNNTIYGKVTIDWGAIPDGRRVLEANSGVVNNSQIQRNKVIKSVIYNNPLGFTKFAKSRSFNDYYSQTTPLQSYASGANSGIPIAPFGDCRKWALKWDELRDNAPAGYQITKEIITVDVLTDTNPEGKLPIYGYSFMPSKLASGDPTGGNSQTLPRIFINCSIHGFEKTPSFVVYEFMKLLINNWKSHSFLEYLRFNVEFVIVPFANPHGWNVGSGAGSRKNFNQVDLNRNFPTFWTALGTPSDPTYPGPAPLSEVESSSIYEFLKGKITNSTLMAVDFHNFHGVEEADPKKYNMLWTVNLGSDLGQSASNVLIKELSSKYKSKSNLIPQSDDYFVGNTNNYNGLGMIGSSMKSLGALYASTFEVCQNFRFNPSHMSHDSDAITFGVESFVNYLRVFMDNMIDEFNRR